MVMIDAADWILWNGTVVTQRQLAALIQQIRDLPIEPELQFEPVAAASYPASARTMNTIKQSGVTRFGSSATDTTASSPARNNAG